MSVLFLSTLSLRRATASGTLSDTSDVISIHALLAESDDILSILIIGFLEFLSTLSLRRATVEKVPADVYYQAFLSTLSLRRATLFTLLCNLLHNDFYPRSPCGERPSKKYLVILGRVISIHALLAESDESIGTLRTVSVNFYPRSPCGERRDASAELRR